MTVGERVCGAMRVKGIILEDGQGRELVLAKKSSSEPFGKPFILSGWQRRRLIPLHHTKQEAQEVMEEILFSLTHLCVALQGIVGRGHDTASRT